MAHPSPRLSQFDTVHSDSAHFCAYVHLYLLVFVFTYSCVFVNWDTRKRMCNVYIHAQSQVKKN